MSNVWVALSLTPPLAVPPLSAILIVIVAVPFWFAAGVYVSVPVDDTAGPAENSPGLVLLVPTNETVCPDSLPGPVLIAVAQVATVCAAASSATDWLPP